jgi:hypothetical protein
MIRIHSLTELPLFLIGEAFSTNAFSVLFHPFPQHFNKSLIVRHCQL